MFALICTASQSFGKRTLAASPRQQYGGTLLGIFLGVLIGVIIAGAVVWMVKRTPPPFEDKTSGLNNEKPRVATSNTPLPGKPGDKPDDPSKSRFDFYKVLPENKDALPAPATPPAPPAPPTLPASTAPTAAATVPAAPPTAIPSQQAAHPAAAVLTPAASVATVPAPGASAPVAVTPAKPAALYLQAGAFSKKQDADAVKAQIALLGREADLEEISVEGKGKMYRVRLGPFTNLNEMNQARNQLAQSGMQSSLIKN